MRQWLIRTLEAALYKLGWFPRSYQRTAGTLPEQVMRTARAWVAKYDEDRQASGEAKRHQVYARLIKEYPQIRKHLLSLAIELAIRERRA